MSFMKELLEQFGDWVLQLLPLSPFKDVINELEAIPYLGYLNWFIPVGRILEIGALWLSAVTVFYLYSIVLRWIRAIE